MFHECIYLQQSKCTKMNSRRVFLFATLTLAAIGNTQASITLDATVTFSYKDGDILDINIFLQCVPKMASTFMLYRETKNCDVYPDQCTELARNETIPENKMITITQPLSKPSIAIYIQLYNQNKEKLTNKTTIMKGTRDENANINGIRENCLNNQYQHNSKCQINVNFGSQCEESEERIHCTQLKERLTCNVIEELPEDTVHQWYQEYENGSFIQPIPQLRGKKTEFKMTLHKFDNNTKIYSIMKLTRSQKDFYSQTFKVSLSKDGFKDYEIQNTIQYAENETIRYFCSNNTNTHVGWIDPIAHNITLNNTTSYIGPFSEKGNNGMFCCISYNITKILHKTVVERSVDNITMIKMKPVNQNNVKVGTTTILPVQPQNQLPVDQSIGAGQGNTNPISLPWIIIAGIVGIILLVVIISIVIKRWCRKTSNPDQTLQLETYGSTNMVLYAELDIRPGPTQPPPTVEDPTYAQIIGVLRPKSEQVNK